MDPITGAALISGVGSLINGGVSSISSRRAAKEYNKGQRKLAEYQNMWNLEQWNRENAYNTPTAQMARLKAAGLNPNLVYGSGGATTQAATSPRAATPEQRPMPAVDLGLDSAAANAGQLLVQAKQFALQQRETDARIQLINAQTAATVQQELQRQLQNSGLRLKNTITKSTLPYQVGAAQEAFRRLQKGNVLLDDQHELNRQKLEYVWKQMDWNERRTVVQETIAELQWARLQLEGQKFQLSEKEYELRKDEITRRLKVLEGNFNMNKTSFDQMQNMGGEYFGGVLRVLTTLFQGYKSFH